MRMATHPLWNDDYWLLVLQLYLKRPTGVKAVYAREANNINQLAHRANAGGFALVAVELRVLRYRA